MNRPGGVTIIAIGHLLGGVFGLMGACAILAIPIPAILPWQRPIAWSSFPVPGVIWRLIVHSLDCR